MSKPFKSHNCRVIELGEDVIAVQYHSTVIVKVFPDHGRRVVLLDTGGNQGGWNTPSQAVGSVTTKRKLNQIADHYGLGFSVHQQAHCWWVTTKAGVYKWDHERGNVFEFDAETGIDWRIVALFTLVEKKGKAA